VIAWLLGPLPDSRSVFYQKHMAHHLLPDVPVDWVDGLTNCFLIRHPREMMTSLIEFIAEPTLRDTGLPQQLDLFERIRRTTGRTPPVVDARDVLDNPRGLLGALCGQIGVAFDDAMLSWPAGRRPTDGVWAKHWYAKVEATTGFGGYRPKAETVPEQLLGLLAHCESIYDELRQYRLRSG
jgi:hypothetical protein